MTSKYLLVADVHLSNKLPYTMPVDNSYLTDRFIGQLNLLKWIAEQGDEHEVDGYIFAGDLFDKSVVDPVTFFEAANAFKTYFSRPVYILPGNHDSVTISGGPYIVDIFGLLGMEVIRHDNMVYGPDVCIYPLEYLAIEDSHKPLKALRKQRAEINYSPSHILLFHNSVVGAKNGNYVSENGFGADYLVDGFDAAFGGHYHQPQKVTDNVEYIGAPMQHHFGDCGNTTGIVLAEYSESGSKYTRLETHGPKFYQYEHPDQINWQVHGQSGDYVRLTIESTVPELHDMADKIREMKALAKDHGVHFFFQHKPIYQHELRMDVDREELSYNALIQDYVGSSDVNTGKLSEKKLVEYGQKILAKAVDKDG